MEQQGVANLINWGKVYNDSAAPNNQVAAKTRIPTYLCPGAVGVEEDPKGYGQTSYMPIAYTDIDPATGLRNTSLRVVGALRLIKYGGGAKISDVADGLSNTMILGEDSSYRNNEAIFPYQSSHAKDPGNVDVNASGGRAINRWADPENGNGVSGPPTGETT